MNLNVSSDEKRVTKGETRKSAFGFRYSLLATRNSLVRASNGASAAASSPILICKEPEPCPPP